MAQIQLAHITDLAKLSDAEAVQFAKDIPGLVATLRLAARAAQSDGLQLADVLPHVTFDASIDDIVVHGDGREVHLGNEVAIEADRLDAKSTQDAEALIARHRRRP